MRELDEMCELSFNELKEINGGLDGGACLALTFSGAVMGGTIGVIGGGMFGPAGMASGGMWGASFGPAFARSFC
jgi:bacteriocin-like protein